MDKQSIDIPEFLENLTMVLEDKKTSASDFSISENLLMALINFFEQESNQRKLRDQMISDERRKRTVLEEKVEKMAEKMAEKMEIYKKLMAEKMEIQKKLMAEKMEIQKKLMAEKMELMEEKMEEKMEKKMEEKMEIQKKLMEEKMEIQKKLMEEKMEIQKKLMEEKMEIQKKLMAEKMEIQKKLMAEKMEIQKKLMAEKMELMEEKMEEKMEKKMEKKMETKMKIQRQLMDEKLNLMKKQVAFHIPQSSIEGHFARRLEDSKYQYIQDQARKIVNLREQNSKLITLNGTISQRLATSNTLKILASADIFRPSLEEEKNLKQKIRVQLKIRHQKKMNFDLKAKNSALKKQCQKKDLEIKRLRDPAQNLDQLSSEDSLELSISFSDHDNLLPLSLDSNECVNCHEEKIGDKGICLSCGCYHGHWINQQKM